MLLLSPENIFTMLVELLAPSPAILTLPLSCMITTSSLPTTVAVGIGVLEVIADTPFKVPYILATSILEALLVKVTSPEVTNVLPASSSPTVMSLVITGEL